MPPTRNLFVAAATLGWIVFVACASADQPAVPPVHVDVSQGPARYLSEYNLFKDARHQIANDGVFPYDVNTPHFADYAKLRRFIWLPAGTTIAYGEDDTLEYPAGTAIVLTLSYPHDLTADSSDEQLVETRLLVLKDDGWAAYQYQWDEAMRDATLAQAGGRAAVTWIDAAGRERALDALVSNINQCKMCHVVNDKFVPLGPLKARNLNRDYPYAGGEENQLKHWQRAGLLRDLPADVNAIPKLPVWDDPATGTVAERARAYLEVNCSGCHQPGGLAYTSGLDLRYTQDIPVRFGVYKSPVAAGRGVGTGHYDIEPGQPERSILFHRMNSTDPGVRMPVAGRSVVHTGGVDLINAWISGMDYPALREAESEAGAPESAR